MNKNKGYSFKKHKINVTIGSYNNKQPKSISDLRLKVFLDGELTFATKGDELESRKVTNHSLNIKKFKFEGTEKVVLIWKSDKTKLMFMKWCSNFRICTQIQDEVRKVMSKYLEENKLTHLPDKIKDKKSVSFDFENTLEIFNSIEKGFGKDLNIKETLDKFSNSINPKKLNKGDNFTVMQYIFNDGSIVNKDQDFRFDGNVIKLF